MKRSIFLAAATILFATGFASAQDAKGPVFATKEQLQAAMEATPCDEKLRLAAVKDLFVKNGASEADIRFDKFDDGKLQNVVITKQGTGDEVVIVGAHYDKTDAGCGVIDNWSGVAIIAHMYGTLRPLQTAKTYVFVAFDKEEAGLKGSAQMAKAMTPEALKKTCAMVNFDSFGMANPMALKGASSGKMIAIGEEVGKQAKFKFQDVDIEGSSSDSATFKRKDIPSITISGLAGNWNTVLHTAGDKMSNLKTDSVYFGYRFGLAYLSKIDNTDCTALR